MHLEEELGTGTPDEAIVPWCGRRGYVWVTTDADPRAREMRMRLLPEHGVEAIILLPQPKGLREQFERIVRHYPRWEDVIGSEPPGRRVWEQRATGKPRRLKL